MSFRAHRFVALIATPLAACAPLPQGSGPALSDSLTALGTEPFWSARVEMGGDGGTLLYQTPEDQAGKRLVVTRRADGSQIEFTGKLGGAALVLVVGAGPCSDGMSDRVYSHSAELRIGRQVLKGCAHPR